MDFVLTAIVSGSILLENTVHGFDCKFIADGFCSKASIVNGFCGKQTIIDNIVGYFSSKNSLVNCFCS